MPDWGERDFFLSFLFPEIRKFNRKRTFLSCTAIKLFLLWEGIQRHPVGSAIGASEWRQKELIPCSGRDLTCTFAHYCVWLTLLASLSLDWGIRRRHATQYRDLSVTQLSIVTPIGFSPLEAAVMSSAKKETIRHHHRLRFVNRRRAAQQWQTLKKSQQLRDQHVVHHWALLPMLVRQISSDFPQLYQTTIRYQCAGSKSVRSKVRRHVVSNKFHWVPWLPCVMQ